MRNDRYYDHGTSAGRRLRAARRNCRERDDRSQCQVCSQRFSPVVSNSDAMARHSARGDMPTQFHVCHAEDCPTDGVESPLKEIQPVGRNSLAVSDTAMQTMIGDIFIVADPTVTISIHGYDADGSPVISKTSVNEARFAPSACGSSRPKHRPEARMLGGDTSCLRFSRWIRAITQVHTN